jgi:protein-tyrosine phosphatase
MSFADLPCYRAPDSQWTGGMPPALHAKGLGFEVPVIDLHCHVLPGIDDGPATIEGSLELARAAAAAGTRTIAATPHVSWEYPNDAGTIALLTEQLNERLRREGIALEVKRGAEVALTRVTDIPAEELARLSLGSGRWLLLEPPFAAAIPGLGALVASLQDGGHRIVIAHPERCEAFHRDRSSLAKLVDAGALVSITAGSLAGRFGRPARRMALDLVRDGLVHNVASDAHDAVRRPPSISAELERAGLGGLAEWLTQAVPSAILDGGEIPPRSETETGSRVARGRRRWPLGRS